MHWREGSGHHCERAGVARDCELAGVPQTCDFECRRMSFYRGGVCLLQLQCSLDAPRREQSGRKYMTCPCSRRSGDLRLFARLVCTKYVVTCRKAMISIDCHLLSHRVASKVHNLSYLNTHLSHLHTFPHVSTTRSIHSKDQSLLISFSTAVAAVLTRF